MNGLLQHHRESTEYLVPAHIVRQARKAKLERLREEKRTEVLAIEERVAPPPNFREMIAAAAPARMDRPVPDPIEVDLRRAQAQAELRNISRELGKMPG